MSPSRLLRAYCRLRPDEETATSGPKKVKDAIAKPAGITKSIPITERNCTTAREEVAAKRVVYAINQKRIRIKNNESDSSSTSTNEYIFDHVFDDDSTQIAVYEESMIPLLLRAFQGQQTALLTYGQTNSGKSYTIFGSASPSDSSSQIFDSEVVKVADEARAAATATYSPPQHSGNGAFAEVMNGTVPGGTGRCDPEDIEMEALKAAGRLAPSNWGLLPRMILGCYALMALQNKQTEPFGEEDTNLQPKLTFSALEIYKESIQDLLTGQKNLKVRCGKPLQCWQDGKQRKQLQVGGQSKEELRQPQPTQQFHSQSVLPELREVECPSAAHMLQQMWSSFRLRQQSATASNSASSRSHYIATVSVYSVNRNTGQMIVGRISVADLAGSERISKAQTSGETLSEGGHINKSLTTLGSVIASLATIGDRNGCSNGPNVAMSLENHAQTSGDSNSKSNPDGNSSTSNATDPVNCTGVNSANNNALNPCVATITNTNAFVNFRNSKLTLILQPCLTGEASSLTLIVTCSVLSVHAAETVSTLRFAQRAMRIRLHSIPFPRRQQQQNRLQQTLQEIEALQKQVRQLEQQAHERELTLAQMVARKELTERQHESQENEVFLQDGNEDFEYEQTQKQHETNHLILVPKDAIEDVFGVWSAFNKNSNRGSCKETAVRDVHTPEMNKGHGTHDIQGYCKATSEQPPDDCSGMVMNEGSVWSKRDGKNEVVDGCSTVAPYCGRCEGADALESAIGRLLAFTNVHNITEAEMRPRISAEGEPTRKSAGQTDGCVDINSVKVLTDGGAMLSAKLLSANQPEATHTTCEYNCVDITETPTCSSSETTVRINCSAEHREKEEKKPKHIFTQDFPEVLTSDTDVGFHDYAFKTVRQALILSRKAQRQLRRQSLPSTPPPRTADTSLLQSLTEGTYGPNERQRMILRDLNPRREYSHDEGSSERIGCIDCGLPSADAIQSVDNSYTMCPTVHCAGTERQTTGKDVSVITFHSGTVLDGLSCISSSTPQTAQGKRSEAPYGTANTSTKIQPIHEMKHSEFTRRGLRVLAAGYGVKFDMVTGDLLEDIEWDKGATWFTRLLVRFFEWIIHKTFNLDKYISLPSSSLQEDKSPCTPRRLATVITNTNDTNVQPVPTVTEGRRNAHELGRDTLHSVAPSTKPDDDEKYKEPATSSIPLDDDSCIEATLDRLTQLLGNCVRAAAFHHSPRENPKMRLNSAPPG